MSAYAFARSMFHLHYLSSVYCAHTHASHRVNAQRQRYSCGTFRFSFTSHRFTLNGILTVDFLKWKSCILLSKVVEYLQSHCIFYAFTLDGMQWMCVLPVDFRFYAHMHIIFLHSSMRIMRLNIDSSDIVKYFQGV